MRRTISGLILFLSACAPIGQAEVTKASHLGIGGALSMPSVQSFPAFNGSVATRSNAEIAADFMDLEFSLESGRTLPVLTRFEGPITVALRGDAPPTAKADLGLLLSRLRSEALIDIIETTATSASIVVEFIPRQQLQAQIPTAACFVAPRVASWEEYRKSRNTGVLDWTTLTRREHLAIFIPSDTTPQDVRDCLHEELAQALGPLNDLYRLPDSVFNDDNFQAVLTPFDMLILKAHYSHALQNGMSAAEVSLRLPALLAKLNPKGEFQADHPNPTNARPWIDLIEKALGPKTPDPARIKAAEDALALARAAGWKDNRLAFSYFVVGRLSLGTDLTRAIASFADASRVYLSLPDGPLHVAHVDMQMAAFALSSGQPDAAMTLADRSIPIALRAQNAALFASLMLIKAQALDQLGRVKEAQTLRLDSLAWARYGFGTDENVRARMAAIAGLSPDRNGG